ncbi:MAG TPA: hypothetical protein VKX17_24325 [Planctomycetota bacterium]|nr:hypothetical protein [Planctomycetota bacterium]
MASYSNAFKKGLKAAKNAVRAKAEIDAVFKDLESDILKDTDGNVKISRREVDVDENDDYLVYLGVANAKRSTRVMAIAAENPKISNGPVKLLARWSQDPRGYPCKIDLGDIEYISQDRDALQENLARMLANPVVGEKLAAFTELQPEQSVA